MTAFAFRFVVERKFSGGSVSESATLLREENQIGRARIVLGVGNPIVFEIFRADNFCQPFHAIQSFLDFLDHFGPASFIEDVKKCRAALSDNLNATRRAFLTS